MQYSKRSGCLNMLRITVVIALVVLIGWPACQGFLITNASQGCGYYPADMVFLLDSSGSVGNSDFAKETDFAASFSKAFDIRPSKVQVGIVTFDNIPYNEFNLNTYGNEHDLANATHNIPYRGGGTVTDEALKFIEANSFTSQSGDRKNVPDILIVITDGQSFYPALTQAEAALLHLRNIKVLAIGVGNNTNDTEIGHIASDPIYVFHLPAFDALTTLQKELKIAVCKIDGIWSRWSSWGVCSASIGCGHKHRNRTCTYTPSNKPRGAPCHGSGSNKTQCGTCPVDGKWSMWSGWRACTATCGGGSVNRNRTCIYSPYNAPHGASCPGSSSDQTQCGSTICPVDGKWGPWSSCGGCSVSYGGGYMTRSRNCSYTVKFNAPFGKKCVGSSIDFAQCGPSLCPVDGKWSMWSNWRSCTATCGGGQKIRHRTCTFTPSYAPHGSPCPGSSWEPTNCGTTPCPVDGKWSVWSGFGACTATCGGGQKNRNRTCTYTPSNAPHGTPCPGSSSDQTNCGTTPCPVDGKWSVWSGFGACTATCGGGQKNRNRTCTYTPSTAPHGATCSGPSSDQSNCGTTPCPVDGKWSVWSGFGACTMTCGGGQKNRNRTCIFTPSNAPRGKPCPGSSSDQTNCGTTPCPVDGKWSVWSGWGTCTSTCGGGQKNRNRTCTYTPSNAPHGASCSGSSSDQSNCGTTPCPVDGKWSVWSGFGACTATCGGGQKNRNRTCTYTPSNAPHGASCPGSTSNQANCGTTPCPVSGTWGNWTMSTSAPCYMACGGTVGGQAISTSFCNQPQGSAVTCPADYRKCSSNQSCRVCKDKSSQVCGFTGVCQDQVYKMDCLATCGLCSSRLIPG